MMCLGGIRVHLGKWWVIRLEKGRGSPWKGLNTSLGSSGFLSPCWKWKATQTLGKQRGKMKTLNSGVGFIRRRENPGKQRTGRKYYVTLHNTVIYSSSPKSISTCVLTVFIRSHFRPYGPSSGEQAYVPLSVPFPFFLLL